MAICDSELALCNEAIYQLDNIEEVESEGETDLVMEDIVAEDDYVDTIDSSDLSDIV